MSGGRLRRVVIISLVVALVVVAIRTLRGKPAPAFTESPLPEPARLALRPVPSHGGRLDPIPPSKPVDRVSSPTTARRVPGVAERAAAVVDDSERPPILGDVAWVPATDGACPAAFPVKANLRSGIFHVPGGAVYERAKAERCYATPEDAVADEMRASKR